MDEPKLRPLEVLVMGDRRISAPWAETMEKVLSESETVEKNVVYSLVFAGKERTKSTQIGELTSNGHELVFVEQESNRLFYDAFDVADIVFFVGGGVISANIMRVVQFGCLEKLQNKHIVFVTDGLEPTRQRAAMAEIGCNSVQFFSPSKTTDILMKVVCERQKISYGEQPQESKKAPTEMTAEQREAQEIRESIARKKQQKQKLSELAKKLEKCARASRWIKSSQEKALAEETLAKAPLEKISPQASARAILDLMRRWNEINSKSFSPAEIQFAQDIWINSKEFKEQQEREAHVQKNAALEKRLDEVERHVDESAAKQAQQLAQSKRERDAENEKLQKAQEELAKQEQKLEKGRRENSVAYADLVGTMTGSSSQPDSYKKTAERTAAATKAREEAQRVEEDLEPVGEVSSLDASAPLLVLHRSLSFFVYDTKSSIAHSRVVRAEILSDTLRWDNQANFTEEQLIKLFANYMSIRHVKSKLSLQLEDKLATFLMRGDEGQQYRGHRDNINRRRATFLGKKYDRVARDLKVRLEAYLKGPFNNKPLPEPYKQVELLIQLLACVDTLERKFFYKSYEKQIKDTITLVDRVYGHLRKADNQFTPAVVNELINELDLPKDAVKILREKQPKPVKRKRAQNPLLDDEADSRLIADIRSSTKSTKK